MFTKNVETPSCYFEKNLNSPLSFTLKKVFAPLHSAPAPLYSKFFKPPKVGKVVYSRIYSRFGKSKCLITNRSGDRSKLTLNELVGDSFKGSCIIRLYQAYVGAPKAITFSVEEILVREMKERESSFFDEESIDGDNGDGYVIE